MTKTIENLNTFIHSASGKRINVQQCQTFGHYGRFQMSESEGTRYVWNLTEETLQEEISRLIANGFCRS